MLSDTQQLSQQRPDAYMLKQTQQGPDAYLLKQKQHSNTSARKSTGRRTPISDFLQNIRGTAAFLPEALAWCRFGREGRFDMFSLGTLPVLFSESFGGKNVRQSVPGESMY